MPKKLLFGEVGLAIYAGLDASDREMMEILISMLKQKQAGDLEAIGKSVLEAMQQVSERQAIVNYLREKNDTEAIKMLKELGYWMSLTDGEADDGS